MADADSARSTSRRAFGRTAAALGGVVAAWLAGIARPSRATEPGPLARDPGTPAARPPPPRAGRRIDVRARGAAGDGKKDDTAAIQRALDEARGGGTVVLPAGRFLAATLHLRDGVTLRLERKAVLLGHPDDEPYDPVEELPYRTGSDVETSDGRFALLAGRGIEGVTIEGEGTIDANRTSRGGPKPVAFKQCRAIRVRGIRIVNSPNYALSFMGCDGIDVEGVTIENSFADGIDPDCCRNVRIADCRVDSVDDGICLKASLALGEKLSTEHVEIYGCTVRSSSNALKLGTESSGDFRDISIRDCRAVYRPPRNLFEQVGAEGGGIALEMVDGGTLEDVTVERIAIEGVPTPIFVRLGNRGREQHPPRTGRLRNVTVRGIRATGASYASSISGLPEAPAQGVRLVDVRIALADGPPHGRLPSRLDAIPERADAYPSPRMFGTLPAAGLYCRHVEALRLEDLHLKGSAADQRPVLVADDLRGGWIEGLRVESMSGPGPIVWLAQARSIALRGARAPAGTGVFLRVSGARSAEIELAGGDMSAAARPVELGPGVAPDAVRKRAD